MTSRFITTHRGREVDPFNLRVDQVDIYDIAHSLARLCRYNGHCRGWLSVARHSVSVARACPPNIQLYGLLHDAAEAYLGDLPPQLKYRPEMAAFLAAEHRAQATIYRAFCLHPQVPDLVSDVDHLMGQEEGAFDGPQAWPTTHEHDETSFLSMYYEITGVHLHG